MVIHCDTESTKIWKIQQLFLSTNNEPILTIDLFMRSFLLEHFLSTKLDWMTAQD